MICSDIRIQASNRIDFEKEAHGRPGAFWEFQHGRRDTHIQMHQQHLRISRGYCTVGVGIKIVASLYLLGGGCLLYSFRRA